MAVASRVGATPPIAPPIPLIARSATPGFEPVKSQAAERPSLRSGLPP